MHVSFVLELMLQLLNSIENYCSQKKNSSKHKPLFKIIGRISGDNAESPN